MKKEIQYGTYFKARYVNEKRAMIDGLRIWRHKNGIALEINGKLTSVNDDEMKRRGNPSLYHKLNDVLLELGEYQLVENREGNRIDVLE